MDVFVARQPIFDRDNNVVAYELLYRNSSNNFFDYTISSNMATSILLLNSYFSFGIDNLINDELTYINFSKSLIENDIPLLLNEKNIIIEVLETIKPDLFFINKIKFIKENGYKIALDDFTYYYPYDELIELADILKVDFIKNTKAEILHIYTKYKEQGKVLLAEKVETHEEYLWAKKLGFDLFQGYFFSKPVILKRNILPDSAYQYFRIISKINTDEPDFKEIAAIIETDVSLTYKLLKLINSRFTLVNNVSSVQHGLAILGIDAFSKWLNLAIIQNISTHKTPEIIKTALIRSRFMEIVASGSYLKKHKAELIMIGILSIIDVLLGMSMEDVLNELPLNLEIKNTLLGKKTQCSVVYDMIKLYEQGEFKSLLPLCSIINIEINKLPEIYCKSVKWADELFEYMQ